MRRKRRACFLLLLLLISALPAEEANSGFLSATAGSNGAFNFSLTPQLSIGKFSVVFTFPLKGNIATDPFSLNFDFSPYLVPERDEGEDTPSYAKRIGRHCSLFIRTMHYGNRYDPFYFRYGKLENITLGDGALLNSFSDLSVGYLDPRPGLNLKVGPIARFGFEYVTDDLFFPTLMAGRLYILPFASRLRDGKRKESRLERMQVAFSLMLLRREGTEAPTLLESSYEFSQPLFSGDRGQTTLFADFLVQREGGKALRLGLWGRTRRWFTFNVSLVAPVSGTYFLDIPATGGGGTRLDPSGRVPLSVGQARVDGTLGLTMDNRQIYAGVRLRSSFSASGFREKRVKATIRVDRFLFNFLTLDFNWEKTYPEPDEEAFLAGLTTMRNVFITGNAQVKINGVKFVLTGSAAFDNEAKVEYSINVATEIVIF